MQLTPKPPAETGVKDSLSKLKAHWGQYVSLGIACLLVIGVWIWSIASNPYEAAAPGGTTYYNLLVKGFRAGQLNLAMEPPAALARLANPYDPGQSSPYTWTNGLSVLDLSYYHGKLYLYFGATPALVLLWPCAALTGHYLPDHDAVLVFCAVGFLAGVGLLYALWRRSFSETGFWVVISGAIALGLAIGTPVLLARCKAYEVVISCGYAFTMLALAGVWQALAAPRRRAVWLAVASLAYGLALGARPNLLFGAGMLLVPAFLAWRRRQPAWGLALAALGPVFFIGLGLLYYNQLRFGNPLEFGMHYQLGQNHRAIQHFSPHFFWYNFRMYFLEPARHFPPGYGAAELAFNALLGVPVVWLGLALPLAWRNQTGMRETVSGLLAAAGWLLLTSTLMLCFYYWSADRYEVEFLSILVLLAVIGMFAVERTLSGQPGWRWAARMGWVLLLVWSVGFDLHHAMHRRGLACNDLGAALATTGRLQEAIPFFEDAIRFQPGSVEAHFNLGGTLAKAGRTDEAVQQFKTIIRLSPDNSLAHYALARTLDKAGRTAEAAGQYQEAIRLRTGYGLAESHDYLGAALVKEGRLDEAIPHFQEALRLKPDYPEAQQNLAAALKLQNSGTNNIGPHDIGPQNEAR